jgi:aspartate/methionine/tyrosine aminotransferase
MAREVGVAAVPGSSFFHEPVNNLIRLHFAKRSETLAAAGERLLTLQTKAEGATQAARAEATSF